MKLITYFFTSWILILTISQSTMAAFEQVADTAGFIYEPRQDIYVSKLDAIQRVFGYSEIFDFFSPLGNIVIDTEPVIFRYRNRNYKIELWKGQYYSSTGAEIGIYEWDGSRWNAVRNEDMLSMSYILKRDGVNLFSRRDVHWWLAGFVPGVHSDPDDLVMENIYIQFKTSSMRNAFLAGLHALGYDDVDDNIRAPRENSTITFNFASPKSPQYLPPWAREYWQIQNRFVVDKFNRRKAQVGRADNSPDTIDKVLGTETLF